MGVLEIDGANCRIRGVAMSDYSRRGALRLGGLTLAGLAGASLFGCAPGAAASSAGGERAVCFSVRARLRPWPHLVEC